MSGDLHSMTIDSLTPGTEYVFWVSAANQHGIGPWSEEVNGATSSVEARTEGNTRKGSILRSHFEQMCKFFLLVYPF